MNILNLFARIGLKADTAQAHQIEKQFKNLKDTVKGVSVAMAGVSLALFKIMDDSLKAAVAFKQFEAETGASSEELQRWQAVAGQTNVSTEALSDAVKSLADNRQKIKLGQGNISGFQLLGIDPDQDPFKILEELKAKTEGLAPAMKKTVLAQMGISAQLIQVLELTNAQFEEMKSNAFVIPKSAINTLSQANAVMNTAGKAIDWIRSLIAVKLAPAVINVTKLFIAWIKENKDGIIKTFKTAFDIIMQFVDAVITTARMLNDAIEKTTGWSKAIMILVGVFTILNRALLFSPIGAIILGIIELIAVMDDLYHYQKGDKESLFGNLAKANPEFKKLLDGVLGVIGGLQAALKGLFTSDWTDFNKMVEKWGSWKIIIQFIVGAVEKLKQLLGDLLTLNFDKLGKDLISGDTFAKAGVSGGGIANFANDALKTLSFGLLGSGSTDVSKVYNITVNGAQSPWEVAQEVQRRIDQKNMATQGNRTGARVQ